MTEKNYVATEIEEEFSIAKAIVSQKIILCRNTQLNNIEELGKKSLSRPRSFLSRQKLLRTQRNPVAIEKTLSRQS